MVWLMNQMIFSKKQFLERGIEGYKFIKDILGAKEAKAIKKPLYQN